MCLGLTRGVDSPDYNPPSLFSHFIIISRTFRNNDTPHRKISLSHPTHFATYCMISAFSLFVSPFFLLFV